MSVDGERKFGTVVSELLLNEVQLLARGNHQTGIGVPEIMNANASELRRFKERTEDSPAEIIRVQWPIPRPEDPRVRWRKLLWVPVSIAIGAAHAAGESLLL